MWPIAHLTLVEQWRQRTPWGFLVVGLIMAMPALIPAGLIHIKGQDPMAGGVLAGLLGFAQFIAVFLTIGTASGLVANDRERGTLLLLVTKPLARFQVLFGKYMGACAFMLAVWLAWGAIAGVALGFKFGIGAMGPALLGFAGSAVASWLVIAFCLFWSCFLPASSTMGLGVLGWLASTSAPRLALAAAGLGHPELEKAFEALHWALPIDTLSEGAKQLASGGSWGQEAAWSLLALVEIGRAHV